MALRKRQKKPGGPFVLEGDWRGVRLPSVSTKTKDPVLAERIRRMVEGFLDDGRSLVEAIAQALGHANARDARRDTPPPTGWTFADYAERWHRVKIAPHYKPRHVMGTRSILDHHLLPALGGVPSLR